MYGQNLWNCCRHITHLSPNYLAYAGTKACAGETCLLNGGIDDKKRKEFLSVFWQMLGNPANLFVRLFTKFDDNQR
jgi:hypothetical protein